MEIELLRQLALQHEPSESYVMDLLATLLDADEERRAWASDALQTIRSPSPQLAPALAAMCSQQASAPVANWACKLLAKLGSVATEHQSAIVEVLEKHPEITVRQQAAQSLGRVPGLVQESIDALARAAQCDDARLRRLAANALR